MKVQAVDYDSVQSLTAALAGQHAVVNALGVGTIPRDIHLHLVDAAYEAGVERFIPSEFGNDTSHPLTAEVPVYADKVAVIQRLKELAEKDGPFSYTAIINGPFLDWGIKHNFLVNYAGPSALICDGGDVPFSATTLAGVGKAVVGVLQHPAETKDRYVHVAEATVTQNQLLHLSGLEDKIKITSVKSEDLEQQAYSAVQKTPPDFLTFTINLLWRVTFGGKFGSLFEKTDNDLLGVKRLSESELASIVKEYAQK